MRGYPIPSTLREHGSIAEIRTTLDLQKAPHAHLIDHSINDRRELNDINAEVRNCVPPEHVSPEISYASSLTSPIPDIHDSSSQ